MHKKMRGFLGTILALHLAVGAFVLAPSPARAAHWYNCRVTTVMEVDGEIRVECSTEFAPGVNAVAMTIAGKPDALVARFVSTATSALLSGRQFRAFATDTACAVSSCRIATTWSLYLP